MNPEPPRIVCKDCQLSQPWRRQEHCLHCGKRLSNWHVAGQLAHQPAPWNSQKPEFPQSH